MRDIYEMNHLPNDYSIPLPVYLRYVSSKAARWLMEYLQFSLRNQECDIVTGETSDRKLSGK